MNKEELLKEAEKSVIAADKAKTEELARRTIAEGVYPLEVINCTAKRCEEEGKSSDRDCTG